MRFPTTSEVRSSVLLIVALLAIVLVSITRGQRRSTSVAHANGQDDRAARIKKEIIENSDPVADFQSLVDSDSSQDNIRRARNRRFDLNDKNVGQEHIKDFEVNESSPEFLFGGPVSNLHPQPALPAAKSRSIIVGKIRYADAFLSNDKTSVYSEFGVDVEQVLRQSINKMVGVQERIAAVRLGGKIRLPSGKLLHRGIEGQPLPKIGKAYLLFLDYDVSSDSFYIVTGYELQGDKVSPLDGRLFNGGYLRQYESYKQYDGMNEHEFLTVVRNAVSNDISNNEKGEKH